MAKGAVKDWTKNATQSVKYTATELGRETAPFLTSTISSTAAAIKDMTDWIKRNTPEKTTNANKESFIKRAVNKGKDTFKVAMDDLKAGNLNFDGINSKFSNSMGDMFDDFADEPNFDFDDDNGDLFGDSSDSDSGSSSFEGLTGEMYASGLEISTKANIDAISQSSNIISQSTLNAAAASTKQLVATNFANTARLSSQLADVILNTKATNDNIASLVEFNNNTITPFISQAQQYMENTEQTLNDIKAILETRLTNPEVESGINRRKDLIRGGIDVSGYFKKIINSSTVQMGMMVAAPVISALQSMGVPMPKFITDNDMISMMGGSFNPMKSIAKYALPSLFGEKKSKLRDIDNIAEYFALTLADKITKSDLFGEFGQKLFDNAYVDKSGYNKDAVVWTGKDSKVLQDVIPSYLSHIETNTAQTVQSLNNVVDILHRTLMGQHGMVKMYDELTGMVLRKSYNGTDSQGKQYTMSMSSTSAARFARNKAMGKDFRLADSSYVRSKFNNNDADEITNKRREKVLEVDENGNPVYVFSDKKSKVFEYDAQGNPVLTSSGKHKYHYETLASDFGKVEAKQKYHYKTITSTYHQTRMSRGNHKANIISNGDQYASSRIWNSNTGDFTDKRKIKKDFEYDLSSTYQPFTEFFELCEKLFKLDETPEVRDDIGKLVSKWANTINEVDASAIVKEIIEMNRWNTKSEEEINSREEMKLRATLVNAKKRFIAARKEIIDSINSGESVYRFLSDSEIDDYRKDIKFNKKDDFIRELVYKSGDKKRIEAYEKQQAQKEAFEKQGDLPFDDVMTDKEFVEKNGKYKDQEYTIDKVVWQVGSKANKIKRSINDAASKIQNNGVDKSAGKMVDNIFGKMVNGFNKVMDVMNGDGDIDNMSKTATKIMHSLSADAAKTASQQAATGAHRIPEEGWWLLHPNERVLTAAEADEYDELMRMLRNGDISPVGSGFTTDPKRNAKIKKRIDAWNKKMANRGFEKMPLSSAMELYGINDDSANGKSTKFTIKRHKPTNDDEKENLKNFTNSDIEKAESREDAMFQMQQELTDNTRSIAAMTAAESDRNAKKAKEDDLDDSKKTVNGLFSKLASVLFGDKDDSGFYANGPFASIANSLINAKRKFAYTFLGKGYVDKDGNVVEGKDVGEEITKGLRDKLTEYKNSAKETLFGKGNSDEEAASTESETSTDNSAKKSKKTKGVRHRVYDLDANGNKIIGANGKPKYHMEPGPADPIEQATEEVAANITEAGDATVEVAFGADDIDTLEAKAKQLAIKDKKTAFAEYAKKLGKGALIGGLGTFALKSSLGTIPSLLFPGGPVAGAILGIGGAMLSQTEAFKKIVFGDLDEDGERTGGLISKNMNERFKKVVPFIVGGAGLGALKKFFLPGVSLLPGPGGALMNMFFGNGPIAGALLGLGGGLLASSEKFKEAIFGEEDEDGELYGGILSKPTEAIRKFYKKNTDSIRGAGIGALAGVLNNRLIASTAGTGGLLYKVFGVGGPIGAAIMGSAIGIATGSEKFKEMLYGKDTGEVDANGKIIRDKSGLIGRVMNVFEINVIRPLAEWGEYARDSFVNWLKHDLGDHVKSLFNPLKEALQDAGLKISDAFGDFGGFVAKVLGMVFHPITKLLPAALKLGVKTTTGILTGAGKMIGGTISAPVKVLDFLMNVAPLGIGKRQFSGANRGFQYEKYGGGAKGTLLNFKDFMLNHKEWNAARQKYGDEHSINKDSGFFYWNKRENAKIDKKDVTDDYKRRKGITKKMQKWAAKDGYNGSIILDDDVLDRRKEWLAKRGVDTDGWTSQDMVDFMYSNDEKRKAKAIADEDAELQREANKADIGTNEEVKTIKDTLIDFKNGLFNRDDTVTKSESDEVERMKESEDDFKATDMPSEESKNMFTAMNAIEHNKSVKSDKEKAKAMEDAKKADSQALAGKEVSEETGDKIIEAAANATEEEESKSGGILSKITEYVGKGLAIGAIGLLATKVNWSGLLDVIKGAVSNIIGGVNNATKDNRTWIDEDTGEEVTATSALSATKIMPRFAKSAWMFATGNNLAAFKNILNGGKLSKNAGGLIGWASARSGARLNEAAWKGFSKINASIHKASNVAKTALKYGDDVLDGASALEKLFTKIYRAVDAMGNSKALKAIGGTWLGKIVTSFTGSIKTIFSKFKGVLSKSTGKLTDALSKGLAKAGVKSVDDFVPILNIVTGATDAIVGVADAANIFHVASSDDLNIRMRFIAAAIGWLKGTMVGSLLDIICEILKDTMSFDFWHFVAVAAYKVIADEDDEEKLQQSIDQLEAECEKYNAEHGTNLSTEAYNDNIKNRTVFTKFLGLFGLETEGEKKAKKAASGESSDTTSSSKSYMMFANTTTDDSNNEGYGDRMSSIGYGIDHYVQGDPRWGRHKYGRRRNGKFTSMATGGCGPTALANAASQLGVNVNPAQVARMAQSNGYTSDGGTNARMFTDGVKKLGLNSSSIGRGGVKSALKHGKKVILSGKGSDGVYTNVGHIISARGLDSRGNAIVDDPMRRRSRHIPLSKLTANSTHAWSIGYGPDLTVAEAFSKFGSPVERPVPNNLVDDGINTLYYSYQQAYEDNVNPDRNWKNCAIYGGEDVTETHSKYDTIGQSGCLLTAISSLVSNFTHRDFDPLSFAKAYGKDYWLPNGCIVKSPDGSMDAIIGKLNSEFGTEDGSTPFAEYLTSYHGKLSVKKSADGTPYTEEFKPSKTNLSGKLTKLKGAKFRAIENENMSAFSPYSYTHTGLFYGNPVVMHGSGYPFTDGRDQHAIVLRGVYKQNDELYTTLFDPGKQGRNATGIPLNDILNDNTLANTTRIITVNGMGDFNIPKSWDEYASAFDKDLGTTHDDLRTDAYDNTTAPKSTTSSTNSESSNTEKPSSLLDAIGNVLSGIGKIAGNIFSALGTKDYMYTSIYDENKQSSLIGGNGFNESVRSATQSLKDYYKNDSTVGESSYVNYKTAGPSDTYAELKKKFKITDFYLNKVAEDPIVGAGVSATYKNIPEVSSSKLPSDVITQMKLNLIPMIASHESGGSFNNVYTDTNGKIAFGIGGFNGSNAAEVLRRISYAISDEVTHIGKTGRMINAKNYFNGGYTDPSNWPEYASKLLAYADKADGNNSFTSSEYNDIAFILDKAPGLAKAAEVAVLNDLLNLYLATPLKKYDDNTLLDPRSIMQLAEFGGYGPAHLSNVGLWNNIKAATSTPELNVANVRDAMIKYYAANTSAFSNGHKLRIAGTAASLLSSTLGFAPDAIMPGHEYGIKPSNYQYMLGEYTRKLNSLIDTENLSTSQAAALEQAMRQQLKDQMDNGADVDLSNLGLGPGSNYSSADIYTDQEDIQRYNSNNPLPVKMNTRPIESRIDTIIQILRQMVKAYTMQQSNAEGYGKAADPIGNAQRIDNAGITTKSNIPLYQKDINENHTDPLRRVFQTIAASPR